MLTTGLLTLLNKFAALARHHQVPLLSILLVLFLSCIWGIVRFKTQFDSALDSSRLQVIDQRTIYLKSRIIVPQAKLGFSLLPAKIEALDGAFFQNHLFVTSNQGLLQLDTTGREVRRYSAIDGLPGNALKALATTPTALWIGVAPQGFLKFNGSQFEYFVAEQATDLEITSLLALPSGELLLGTKQRGLLVFQGNRATEFTPTIQSRFITSLHGDDRQLMIGTFSDGLYLYKEGILHHLQKNTGEPGPLLDNQITAIVGDSQALYVGTPLGINEIRDGKVSRTLAQGLMVRSLALGSTLIVGTDDGVVSVRLSAGSPLRSQRQLEVLQRSTGEVLSQPQSTSMGGLTSVNQIFSWGDLWLALGTGGVFQSDAVQGGQWQRFDGRSFLPDSTAREHSSTPEEFELTHTNTTALAFDRDQYLWVGYFDHGLDIFSERGERLAHQEDDRVFCVNHILPLSDERVAVSTANGLGFYQGRTLRSFVTEKEGLIHKSVAMAHSLGSGKLLAATAEGVTIFEGSLPAQNLFALHGLINNHVYSATSLNGRTYLGTLGGMTVLEKSQVLFSWNTSNSGLGANWINALTTLRGRVFVGTYGGGLQSVDSNGQWTDYSAILGKFEVNPNAMAVDKDHLYVGTLDKGFFVYDAGRDRWQQMRDGLPSQNVTTFAFNTSGVLVGTDRGVVRIQKEVIE